MLRRTGLAIVVIGLCLLLRLGHDNNSVLAGATQPASQARAEDIPYASLAHVLAGMPKDVFPQDGDRRKWSQLSQGLFNAWAKKNIVGRACFVQAAWSKDAFGKDQDIVLPLLFTLKQDDRTYQVHGNLKLDASQPERLAKLKTGEQIRVLGTIQGFWLATGETVKENRGKLSTIQQVGTDTEPALFVSLIECRIVTGDDVAAALNAAGGAEAVEARRKIEEANALREKLEAQRNAIEEYGRLRQESAERDRRLAESTPPSEAAKAKLGLAGTYLAAGMTAKAKELLESIVADFPDTSSAAAAKEQLQKMGGQANPTTASRPS